MALNYSLLIVDPDRKIKSSISNVLGDEFNIGQILTASTGKEALKLLSDHDSIDCIIASSQLNDNTGFSLISDIKQDQKYFNTSVLLMSDKKDPSHILKAAACGASDLILKPFDQRSLTLKLKKLILGKQSRKHLRISTLEAFDIKIIYSDTLSYDAKLLDISRGGCYVKSAPMTSEGRVYDNVSLTISNENEVILTIDAELIRVERDPECEYSKIKKVLAAFQFDGKQEMNTGKIEKFLNKFIHKK